MCVVCSGAKNVRGDPADRTGILRDVCRTVVTEARASVTHLSFHRKVECVGGGGGRWCAHACACGAAHGRCGPSTTHPTLSRNGTQVLRVMAPWEASRAVARRRANSDSEGALMLTCTSCRPWETHVYNHGTRVTRDQCQRGAKHYGGESITGCSWARVWVMGGRGGGKEGAWSDRLHACSPPPSFPHPLPALIVARRIKAAGLMRQACHLCVQAPIGLWAAHCVRLCGQRGGSLLGECVRK
jgi:hypothetical protein